MKTKKQPIVNFELDPNNPLSDDRFRFTQIPFQTMFRATLTSAQIP
jgi:hypothetical protein